MGPFAGAMMLQRRPCQGRDLADARTWADRGIATGLLTAYETVSAEGAGSVDSFRYKASNSETMAGLLAAASAFTLATYSSGTRCSRKPRTMHET